MKQILGDRLVLKEVTEDDVTVEYVTWMNDYDVVRYTESRGQIYDQQAICEYVEKCYHDHTCILFGIFDRQCGDYIGNIKINNINKQYNHADLGILIGNIKYWGRGFGSEAVALCTEYAFNTLGLHKIIAGCFEINYASKAIFLKNGYKIAYIKKDDVFFEGKYLDVIILEKFNDV